MRDSQMQSVQRKPATKDQSELDQPATGQFKAAPPFQLKASATEEQPRQLSASPGGLPAEMLTGFADSTGHDLSDVQVHRNSTKPAQVGALAYAQGNDIHLAAGQEQHLAHEAAHIVQQREGRVQATTTVGDMPVNDSQTLEREADGMGEAAMMRKAAPQARQPKQLKARGTAQRKVAQRQVDSRMGTFDTATYHLGDGDGNKIDEQAEFRGVNITLNFDAKDPVDAEQIALVQTANTWLKGKPYHSNKTDEDRSLDHGASEGSHIDQYSKSRNPLYAVQEQPKKKTGLEDGITKHPFGEHGYHYKNWKKDTKHKTAWLYDLPSPPVLRPGPDCKQVFETTALVTKGKHSTLYLGSVSWGWETDGEGKLRLLPLRKVSDGTPSAAFQESAALWNQSTTQGGEEVVKLPIVTDVHVLTSKSELMSAPEDGEVLKKLPAGARVQPTGDRRGGMSKVIVLDGTKTFVYGKGWINTAALTPEQY